MLSFHNVAFHYKNQSVFNELNFHLDKGDFTFLIGKSGTGKSTFLQLIYMNLMPHSGYVKVGDYNSLNIQPKDIPLLRRKLGVVFQDFRLLTDRNIFDNLAFVLEVTRIPRKEIKKRVYDALALVGLTHKSTAMPSQLSGGEQQRVAIARAIINNPMLILADEPTGNLDPEISKEILEIFRKINESGTSVIFATHNYDLVKRMDAKILKLDGGKAVKVVLKNRQS